MNHFVKYRIVFGNPVPGYRFKPGECIVDKNSAEQYRQGQITLDKFDGVKLVVLENAVDPTTNVESYHVLYNSPLKEGQTAPWGSLDQWFTKAYVDSNFESCEHPAP
jgi:hypothetical protein